MPIILGASRACAFAIDKLLAIATDRKRCLAGLPVPSLAFQAAPEANSRLLSSGQDVIFWSAVPNTVEIGSFVAGDELLPRIAACDIGIMIGEYLFTGTPY